MKTLEWFNNVIGKLGYRIGLPIFGDKKCIYTVKGANWWAYYAYDTKKWIFVKGEYRI